MTNMTNEVYSDLIQRAINEPGTINQAYSLFHDYSLLNSLYASYQMKAMKIDITPIKTFKGWNDLGKSIAKGSKAIEILYPNKVSFKVKDEETGKEETITYIKGFFTKRQHFAASQLKDYGTDEPQRIKLNIEWDRVLKDLKLERVKWNTTNGNAQGWCNPTEGTIAINPICKTIDKTMLHEVAHALMHKDSKHSREIKEVQAETVAYIVLNMIGCDNQEVLSECRGYIQNWLKSNELEPKISKEIMNTANKLMEVISNKPKKEYTNSKRG